MRKIFILFYLFFFISFHCFAQHIFQGKILDATTSEPLESVIIRVAGKNGMTAVTQSQGDFLLKFNADTCQANVSMIGYKSKTIIIYKQQSPLIYIEKAPLDLKEIVITSQSNNFSFHNLSAIDINMRPVNSSQDLMRLVPGLFLGQHQGGGIAEHIFFRGFDADHGTDVNVSVDGMPVNLVSQAHGQGFTDLHFLIPELVTTYEFGKGPYYSSYGDFATAGYVSFKTKDALDKNMFKIEGGQFNTTRLMTMINLLSNKAKQHGESAYLAAEDAYTDGPFHLPQKLNRINLFGKYNMDINKANRVTINLSTFNSGWNSSGEIPERAVKLGITSRFGYIDSLQGGSTGRSTAIIKLHSFISDKLEMQNEIYYLNYFFNLHYDDTFFADDSINGDQLRQKEARDELGYNGKLIHHKYFLNDAVLVSSIGGGMQYNAIHNSELSHTKNETIVLEYLQLGDIKQCSFNLFFNETFQSGRWLLDAGSRIDYMNFNYQDKLNQQQPSREKVIASPKLNIQYTANKSIQVYLKTGKGFHSNNAKVVVANKGEDILPACYGADIGVNWKPASHLYINAALWYLYLKQEFVYDADEGTIEPGGKTKRKGIDVSFRYQFYKWLFASLDVNACKARSVAGSKGNTFLPLAVPFSSTGGLDFKFHNGLNGGLSYRYMTDRPADENNTFKAQGYFVTDFTANYTKSKYEIGLEIQNLFNTKWREAQFEVTSRLQDEAAPVDDINFSAGAPFFAKLKFSVFF